MGQAVAWLSGAGSKPVAWLSRAGRRRVVWLFAGLALASHLGLCWLFFSFTADDAFIVARYAENLVRGYGLVFNAGEPINALTCPLLALVEAGIYALTGQTLPVYKMLSIGLVVAAHVLCLRYLRHSEEAVWLFCGLMVMSPFVALWTTGGMETPVLLFLVTAATLLFLRTPDRGIDRATAAAISVVLGLSFLTRYDSVLFCAPVGLCLVARHPRRAAWLIGPAIVIAGGWLLFAQWCFHDVLPTSFYVKKPIWRSWEVKRTAAYLLQFVISSGLVVLLVWIALRLIGGGARSWRAARARVATLWGLYAGLGCFLVYAMMNATKHMMFSYRMIIPFLPTIAVVLLDLHRAANSEKVLRERSRPATAIFVLLIAVQVFFAWQIERVSLNPGFVGEYLRWGRRSYVEGFSRALKDSARAIRRHWQSQPDYGTRRPRMSTFAGGITPYYLPEAYVYETLVSYRHNVPFDAERIMAAVDYRQEYVIKDALSQTTARTDSPIPWRVVATYDFRFDGRWAELRILYNPDPAPYPLPAYVDGAVRWTPPE